MCQQSDQVVPLSTLLVRPSAEELAVNPPVEHSAPAIPGRPEIYVRWFEGYPYAILADGRVLALATSFHGNVEIFEQWFDQAPAVIIAPNEEVTTVR